MLTFPPAGGALEVSAVKPAAEKRTRAAKNDASFPTRAGPSAEGRRLRDRVVIRSSFAVSGSDVVRQSVSGSSSSSSFRDQAFSIGTSWVSWSREHREKRAASCPCRNLCAGRISRATGRAGRQGRSKENCRVGRGKRTEFAHREGLARRERGIAT